MRDPLVWAFVLALAGAFAAPGLARRIARERAPEPAPAPVERAYGGATRGTGPIILIGGSGSGSFCYSSPAVYVTAGGVSSVGSSVGSSVDSSSLVAGTKYR